MRTKVIVVGLIMSLFLISIISASCYVTPRANCVGNGNIILGLSDTTDAHGELASQGNYNYVLCCNEGSSTSCDGSNKIVGFEFATNSHAEIPSLSVYTNSICFEDFSCTNRNTSCNSGEVGILSLSANTNAHIGGFNDYETKICCTSKFLIDDGICGNGILGAGEECDDGNLINYDGCSSVCENEVYNSSWCQDGILFAGYEECDDGNAINGDGCTSTCRDEGDDDDDQRSSDSSGSKKCNPNWDCTSWSICDDGFKTRTCIDLKHCGTSSNKPDEASSCKTTTLSSIGNSVISLSGNSENSKVWGISISFFWILLIAVVLILILIGILLLR